MPGRFSGTPSFPVGNYLNVNQNPPHIRNSARIGDAHAQRRKGVAKVRMAQLCYAL